MTRATYLGHFLAWAEVCKDHPHLKEQASIVHDLVPDLGPRLPEDAEPNVFCGVLRSQVRALFRDPASPHHTNPHPLRMALIAVQKSNLLARTIYGGEPVRTTPCPVHAGTWSGLEPLDAPCPHGCGYTGWLP